MILVSRGYKLAGNMKNTNVIVLSGQSFVSPLVCVNILKKLRPGMRTYL